MKPHRRPLNTGKGVFILLRLWAIALLTLRFTPSLCQAQKSPNFHLILKIFLAHVRVPVQARSLIHVRMDMYTVYNLISTFVDNHA
jgi:hypothetical protein